jgi:hypothetical protein
MYLRNFTDEQNCFRQFSSYKCCGSFRQKKYRTKKNQTRNEDQDLDFAKITTPVGSTKHQSYKRYGTVPAPAASWSGVQPAWSVVLGSAPSPRYLWREAVSPRTAAACSGVSPFKFFFSRFFGGCLPAENCPLPSPGSSSGRLLPDLLGSFVSIFSVCDCAALLGPPDVTVTASVRTGVLV